MFDHFDAFTAMAFVVFGLIIGSFMVPIQFILQVSHDSEGLGWKTVVYTASAFGLGFGVIVAIGSALEGAPYYLQHGLAVAVVLVPSSLVGGFLGRLLGWLVMRGIALLNR